METKYITKKLANELLDTLACLALSATCGVPEKGIIIYNQKQIDFAEVFARSYFNFIIKEIENELNIKIEIREGR